MKIKIPTVLFFTLGMVPTEEELAQGLAARARFRNASLHQNVVEKCDFVMGAVPEQYADVPRWAGAEAVAAGNEGQAVPPQAGEAVGAFFLHQVARGKWNVFNEDGAQLNEEPLSKTDARTLALENTEED